jgi:hypothetical protein
LFTNVNEYEFEDPGDGYIYFHLKISPEIGTDEIKLSVTAPNGDVLTFDFTITYIEEVVQPAWSELTEAKFTEDVEQLSITFNFTLDELKPYLPTNKVEQIPGVTTVTNRIELVNDTDSLFSLFSVSQKENYLLANATQLKAFANGEELDVSYNMTLELSMVQEGNVQFNVTNSSVPINVRVIVCIPYEPEPFVPPPFIIALSED